MVLLSLDVFLSSQEEDENRKEPFSRCRQPLEPDTYPKDRISRNPCPPPSALPTRQSLGHLTNKGVLLTGKKTGSYCSYGVV
jgi:hypothetical protein